MNRVISISTAFALSAVALTGCAAATAPGSATSTGSSGASTSSGSTGGQAAPVNTCAVMPAAAASSAAGITFTSAKEDDSIKGVYECDYGTSGYNWSIAVYEAPDTENLNSLLLDLGGASNSKAVSGIGDKAYVSPVAVAAQFGNRFIEVGSANNSASNEAGYEALAKATIAAIK
jgi:hypothetical protein